ncbi:MAG: hypothetical protein RSD29_03090 [Bacilli bacterium]
MLEISKEDNELGYLIGHSINIITSEGTFKISFAGNLDLYWSFYSFNFNGDEKSFTITKENYFIYTLFLELYNNIKDCNVGFNVEDGKHFKDKLKSSEAYNKEKLFENGVVTWHSDDFEYEKSSILKIEEVNDTFVVTFIKSKDDSLYDTFAVRIRNSGSRYEPFNVLFMKMYRKLVEYDPFYHQIHIEELMYQDKLERKLKK